MNTKISSVQSASTSTSMSVSSPGGTARAANAAVSQPTNTPTVELDPTTQQPVAVRFPWLSRLATALEAVSTYHWPFKSVQVTGENVDGSA